MSALSEAKRQSCQLHVGPIESLEVYLKGPIIESCRRYGVEPYTYLRDVLSAC